ncbi:hypothetical protein K402DRAFT_427267 [Aulographum hederae CBS 113979]|uniref:Uncharacterized protein n=1 Tax=Aulographum hederae CBS 113979 TaxID=1176131 RepID=A0A6G1H6B3_9PEZI|nr:hypothetical protein K402DRAFT_427267 [Aulographum hederae CBS 113979]
MHHEAGKLFGRTKREDGGDALPFPPVTTFDDALSSLGIHDARNHPRETSKLSTVTAYEPKPEPPGFVETRCKDCSSLPLSLFTDGQDDTKYLLKTSVALLIPSASEGCPVCSIVYSYLTRKGFIYSPDSAHKAVYLIAKRVFLAEVCVGCILEGEEVNAFMLNMTRLKVHTIGEDGGWGSEEGDGTENVQGYQAISLRNDSDATFYIAKRWLDECKRNHLKCKKKWGPSRLPM